MKQALVIGASGGIGAALCTQLEQRGYAVTGLSRAQDGLDVTDEASVAQAFSALSGPFEVVIVATGTLAAGGAPEKTLAAIEAQRMLDVYAVNAVGPALVLGQLGRLLPKDTPSFVGVLTARVGSIGDNRMGGWYSYRASKAAANQIVHGAAIELGRRHKEAAIVALHPGTVETKFTANYKAHAMVPAETAAANLCDVLLSRTPAQSGGFFDYAGEAVPW